MSHPIDQGIMADDSRFYGLAAILPKLAEALPGGDKAFIRLSEAERRRYREDTKQHERRQLTMEAAAEESSTPAMFRYQPLEGEMSFRLLVIHPGGHLDPLSGTIEHDVVREKNNSSSCFPRSVKFDAVSYAWSSDVKTCSITINGQKAMITQSLFNALVCFRYSDRDRRIWADALCINQEDNKERAAQVTLMPEIYTFAAKTLVYLGEQSDHSELVPRLIDTIVKLDTGKLHKLRSDPNKSDVFAAYLPAGHDIAREAIMRFFCRPWFSRVWVIQELILARDARFYCGDWELSWWRIAEMGNRFDKCFSSSSGDVGVLDFMRAQQGAASIALMHGLQHTRSTVAGRLSDLEAAIAMPLTPLEPTFDLAPDILAQRNAVIESYKIHPELFPQFEEVAFGLDTIKTSTTSILKLLGVFSPHNATIPQDKLFALVGLAADIDLKVFPPDYEESERETNARFSRELVKKGQGMDVLYHATKSLIELATGFYPSWSPYWTMPQSMQTRHWLKFGWAYSSHPGGFGAATIPADAVSLVEGEPNMLKVRASYLDSLRGSTCVAKIEATEFKLHLFAASAKIYFKRISEMMSGTTYLTGESWDEVQCRTLVANHGVGDPAAVQRSIDDYVRVKQMLPDLLTPRAESSSHRSEWGSKWFDLVGYYAACRTSQGYVGLVPNVTTEGDQIVMLQGSNLPFVLRPTQFPGHFQFIGGCYVHGLMKGEAWKYVAEQKEILLM